MLFLAACQTADVPRSTVGSTSPPTAAPAGLAPGRVVYSRYGLDLWASAPDGSGRAALTTDGASGPYLSARPAPDGKLIAAERSMPGDPGTSLYLLRPAVAALRLTRPDMFLDGYAWSPDGRYLAYGEVASGITAAAGGLTGIGAVGDVHLYDVGAAKDIVVGPGTHPAFSPDGARLGFAHLGGAIAVADVRALADRGSSAFQILTTLADLTRYSTQTAPKGMGLIGGPQFSADGKYVAYAAIEKGPILEAEQIVYVQEASPGAPPTLFVVGKTGAIHHVADMRWSPTAPVLSYTIINAQPHHHWLYVIDARTGERRELYDSQKHFLDHTWSPDGKTILVQVDDGDEWLYFRPERAGPVGRIAPGGWHPEWCACDLRSLSP
ncbi:MAG: PD40 domain-containing protein [Chloroflexi bacterium]|nr:PD40 domain-containing protein [Chloroflexota bacterium]